MTSTPAWGSDLATSAVGQVTRWTGIVMPPGTPTTTNSAAGSPTRWATADGGGERGVGHVGYAVGWIEQAIRRLDVHIHRLRQLLSLLARAAEKAVDWIDPPESGDSMKGVMTPPSSPVDSSVPADPLALVTTARHDIAVLLRRLVELVGRYAALYLPEEARVFVRNIVVGVARRWAGGPPTQTDQGYEGVPGKSFKEGPRAREEGAR
ncbi:hypothetical protein HDU93_006345, partial [Gonapodya sp. JEL0774]